MMRQDSVRSALLESPARHSIVTILSNLPPLPTPSEPRTRGEGFTASELGERLGLHVTTVRFHVDQLVAAHVLRFNDVRLGVGRPRRHYSIEPSQLDTANRYTPCSLLAEVLTDAFAQQMSEGVMVTPHEASQRWVERFLTEFEPTPALRRAQESSELVDQVAVLVDLLERWGYKMNVAIEDDGATVQLNFPDCPMKHLADRHPDVALGLHEGLIRAALAAFGASDVVIENTRDAITQEWRTRIASATPAVQA